MGKYVKTEKSDKKGVKKEPVLLRDILPKVMSKIRLCMVAQKAAALEEFIDGDVPESRRPQNPRRTQIVSAISAYGSSRIKQRKRLRLPPKQAKKPEMSSQR